MYAVGLASAGVRSVIAADSSSACQRLSDHRFDAVVADLAVFREATDGELLRQVTSVPAERPIPVIGLTTYSGCAAIVSKPCLPNELADVLSCVLVAREANTAARVLDTCEGRARWTAWSP